MASGMADKLIDMDKIVKWFKAPKTIQGLVGFTVIIILLGVDFWWWANNIEVSALAEGVEEGEEEEESINWTLELAYEFEQTETLIAPSGPLPLPGQFSSVSYNFPVGENAYVAYINTTHTGTNLRPDVDLYVYGPNGDEVGSCADEDADESVELSEKVLNRTGAGEYTATVNNFSSFGIEISTTIYVYDKVFQEMSEEEEE